MGHKNASASDTLLMYVKFRKRKESYIILILISVDIGKLRVRVKIKELDFIYKVEILIMHPLTFILNGDFVGILSSNGLFVELRFCPRWYILKTGLLEKDAVSFS